MDSTTLDSTPPSSAMPPSADAGLGLVVAWSASEPARVGELLLLPGGERATPHVFGRGGPRDGDPHERLLLARQRPGKLTWCAPLDDPFLSRAQLELSATAAGLRVRNVGRCSLLSGGAPVDEALLSPGACVELRGRLLLLCVRRPLVMTPLRYAPQPAERSFGEADAQGLVGESPALWALRDEVAFVAGRSAHALVLGESGSGKELVAQAIHALSARAGRRMVARNAATLPAGLVDAELFGNTKNYPNPGLPERPGLIGEASGSTLFLDEIGELPIELQTHLLRVLDQGDYQRLGEAAVRKSDLRLIGATNRPLLQLKHDLAARLPLRIVVPGLNERREDIPLLARHLLRRIARGDPEIGRRFFAGWDGSHGEPRLGLSLVRSLVTHPYSTHVRELAALLWRSIAQSPGDTLAAPHLDPSPPPQPLAADAPPAPVAPHEVSRDEILAALQRCGGVQERAWKELGLASRYVLKRLMKKHGLSGEG